MILRRLQGGLLKVRERQNETPAVGVPQGREEATNRLSGRRLCGTTRGARPDRYPWLDYELDVTKLLDYPLMTDMRDPHTQRFHRAKLRADLLRPADAGDLLDDADAAREYRDAVEEYVTAFDVAEAEAIRRRRRDFSREEQQRLTPRAQRAADRVRHRGDAAGARTRLRGCTGGNSTV